MTRVSGGCSRLIVLLAITATVALASPIYAAHAAPCAPAKQAFPLHAGSCGQHVSDLQWLLHGGKPYVFRQVKPTFKPAPNGSYGARTKAAVLAMKYRIGYPKEGQCGAKTTLLRDTTTRYFFYLLEGKATRPACWVALAASRVHAVNPTPHPSTLGQEWAAILGDWLGISEQPDSSNAGPCISRTCTWHGTAYPAIQSSTGAYDQAWCVSAEQEAAALVGYGHFADDTASVYQAVDYYAARNLVFAKVKLYAIVAFLTYGTPGSRGVDSKGRVIGTGHMGFVTAVYANSFTYRAGNDGNAVREHTIDDGSRSYAFIYLPGIA